MLEVFAADEYQDFATYRELAKIETNPKFKKVLEKLANYELEHFNFWLNSSSRKTFRVKRSRIFWLKLLRRILGLTFTIKFMERHEKGIIAKHERHLLSIQHELKGKLKTLIESEIQSS